MPGSWFGRLSRRTPVNDVRPGNRYRRRLGSCLAATATVLELRSDLVGIPHVQFAVAVDGSAARLSDGDTRVLALESFIDTYREPLAQEAQPDPSVAAGAGYPIIAEAVTNLIVVSSARRACRPSRLRHDKRSALQSSGHMTPAP